VKRSTRVQKLAKAVTENLWTLGRLAEKGAEEAAEQLYETAAMTIEFLTVLSQRNPELFSRIAGKKFSWPVMFNTRKECIEEHANLVKTLKLAADTGVKSSGKPFSWDNPANVVAFNLYKLAESLRQAPMSPWSERELTAIATSGIGQRLSAKVDVQSRKYDKRGMHVYNTEYERQLKALKAWAQRDDVKGLPPLSKRTAREWWIATKELFEIAYSEEFEQHPKLQELRIQILDRAKNAYEKQGRGEVRKYMRQALKQAWSSIAPVD
jgi:hypothetical protein